MNLDMTGIGSVANFAGKLVDFVGGFFPEKMSDAEKAQAQLAIQQMVDTRDTALIEAQKSIIVAEMQQADTYTKRARPSVVYAGLFFIFLVHVAFPIISYIANQKLPTLSLPEEFWWAWSGVCAVWVLGRSAEKRGAGNTLTKLITGSK